MADIKVRIQGDASGLLNAANQAERALRSIKSTASSLQSALGGALAVMAGGSLFSFVDGLQNMQNKLRTATSGSQEFSQAMEAVRAIADKTGQSLQATGDLYSKVAQNAGRLGLSVEQVAAVTNAFALANKAGGASAQSASAAMYQFSQILNKGKIEGDDFNTIMEAQGGVVLPLLAKNLGISTEKIREFASKGLINAKDLTYAYIRSLDELQQMSGKTSQTLGQSMQKIQNAFATSIIKIDEATGFSSKFADIMEKVASNGDNLIPIIKAMGIALGVIAVVMAPIPTIFAAVSAAALYFADVLGPILKPVIDLVESALAGLIKRVYGFGAAIKAALSGENPFEAYSKAVEEFEKKADTSTKNISAGNAKLEKSAQAAAAATGQQSGQLSGVATKYQEIIKELTAEAEIRGTNNRELEIAKQILNYNKQLQYQLTDSQKQELTTLLTKIQANKTNLLIQQELNAVWLDSQAAMKSFENYQGNLNSLTASQLETETKILKTIAEMEAQYGKLTYSQETSLRASIEIREEYEKQLDLMRQMKSNAEAFNTPMFGAAAGAAVSGQLGQLDPATAARTQLATQLAGLQELRNQDLINEQTYQNAKLQATISANDAIYNATKKRYQNEAQLRIQEQYGSILSYQQQQEAARSYAEFEMKSTAEKTAFALEQGGQIFSALGAQNKKAFETAKAFNIANAIMNTYMAVTKSLAMYPWPFNLVAAGASLAMGMAQVAQIRSQQYSGREKGGPVAGGMPYIVGEAGPEIFTPSSSGTIIPNNQLGTGGGVNVNFNITTVDANGFDDLLVSRRGVITGIINDAMLERGSRGL